MQLSVRENAELLTRSVTTQTVYRDSSTQTAPYSPPVKKITNPPKSLSELMQLSSMVYGNHWAVQLIRLINLCSFALYSIVIVRIICHRHHIYFARISLHC
jgi:Cilia- and flagella-associated protein 91